MEHLDLFSEYIGDRVSTTEQLEMTVDQLQMVGTGETTQFLQQINVKKEGERKEKGRKRHTRRREEEREILFIYLLIYLFIYLLFRYY